MAVEIIQNFFFWVCKFSFSSELFTLTLTSVHRKQALSIMHSVIPGLLLRFPMGNVSEDTVYANTCLYSYAFILVSCVFGY